jgi:hypothetical protein
MARPPLLPKGTRIITLCLLCLAASAQAEERAIPFRKGEFLSYQISWSFIPAGRATLEVAASSDRELDAAHHFIMTAKTLPALDLIYRYRERVDSWVATNVHHSLQYKKVQESSHPRDSIVRFDWHKLTAQYSNYGKTNEPIAIQPGTLDPLSALYYIRMQFPHCESPLEQWVTDGSKLAKGKALLLTRETITIRGKGYRTIKIEPDIHEVKGVFEKSPGAKMHIWLTDDDQKILVKLQSKVRVGSFVAELIEEESRISGVTTIGKREAPVEPPISGAKGLVDP